MAEFRQVTPDEFDFLGGKSIDFLEQGAAALYNYFTVPMAVQRSLTGSGKIYQVFDKNRILGCFFIDFVNNHIGKTMNLILLGGEEMDDWSEDFSKFLHVLAEQEDVDELTVFGRKGWGRRFPNLEHFACLYRQKRERLPQAI